MRLVVSHNDGTGNFAEARGYMVGGKTGTAEKAHFGGYNKKANLATFVATFPVHDPRYVIVILVDEPKGKNILTDMQPQAGLQHLLSAELVNRLPPCLGFFLLTKIAVNSPKNAAYSRLVIRRRHLRLIDLSF